MFEKYYRIWKFLSNQRHKNGVRILITLTPITCLLRNAQPLWQTDWLTEHFVTIKWVQIFHLLFLLKQWWQHFIFRWSRTVSNIPPSLSFKNVVVRFFISLFRYCRIVTNISSPLLLETMVVTHFTLLFQNCFKFFSISPFRNRGGKILYIVTLEQF